MTFDTPASESLLLRSQGFDFAATPALIASIDGEVIAANRAANALLAPEGTDLVGQLLRDHGSDDDWARLASTLGACESDPAHVGAMRFRFIAAGWKTALVEMMISACAGPHEGRSVVNIQMRDVSRSSSMTTFLWAASDLSDGDVLLNALAAGPWKVLRANSLVLFSVDHEEKVLRACGSHGRDDRRRRTFSVVPLNAHTVPGVCALASEAQWLDMAEIARRFPLVAPEVRRSDRASDRVAVCLPLTSRGVVAGVVMLNLGGQTEPSLQVWETLMSGAQVLTMWLLATDPSRLTGQVPVARGVVRAVDRLTLSQRDHDVLRLVAQRRTNREIADVLGYSEATIRADLTRMGKLLDVSGRQRILQRAREMGLHGS